MVLAGWTLDEARVKLAVKWLRERGGAETRTSPSDKDELERHSDEDTLSAVDEAVLRLMDERGVEALRVFRHRAGPKMAALQPFIFGPAQVRDPFLWLCDKCWRL